MNEERFTEAYIRMVNIARYRPAAPGDGFGGIYYSKAELEDLQILEDEVARYNEEFKKEEQQQCFLIGRSTWETNRALVYIIEAARSINGANNEVALKLLKMATDDIEEAEQRKISA
jgi:hypothetical protein